MRCTGCALLTAASVVTPLLLILVAAVASGWFDLLENALSDLGHATKSNVAAIFNLGLSAGGLLISLTGALCASKRSRLIGYTLVAAGYALTLVAVFDMVYGHLHFYASVMFFLLIAALLVEYSLVERGLRAALALAGLAVCATAWALHLAWGVPKGAAVPELISIAVVLPFYLDFTLRA